MTINYHTLCQHVHKTIKMKFPNRIFGDQGIQSALKQNNTIHHWRPRILIIGRRGSGRKIQAALISKQFQLVYSITITI